MPIDLPKILEDLSKSRPVFHSEADFQHALAWEIQKKCENAEIRLEKPYRVKSTNELFYIDLLVQLEQIKIAIELKYKTLNASFSTSLKDAKENFNLAKYSAQNINRYLFLKDIYRLEQFVQNEGSNSIGYAILLTNVPSYWKNSPKLNSTDIAFKIHDNRMLTKGYIAWAEHTAQTTINKYPNFDLIHDYILNWKPYSKIDDEYEFNYLLVPVKA